MVQRFCSKRSIRPHSQKTDVNSLFHKLHPNFIVFGDKGGAFPIQKSSYPVSDPLFYRQYT